MIPSESDLESEADATDERICNICGLELKVRKQALICPKCDVPREPKKKKKVK